MFTILINRVLFSTIVLGFTVIPAISQNGAQKPKADEPSEKVRKVSNEPNDVFKHWLNNDVPYIITAAERAAFVKLTTNEERENFIKTFWDRRDPDPDTEENEYREQYYERIAYANEHFASGIPGWKTDRGRIYITWGKPDSIDAHSSGGSYDRPSYEGGGSATAYPFETWFYRHLDDVGEGVEVEFVDRTGTGEYRLSRDPDEKIVSIGGLNASQTTNGSTPNYQREQDSPFAIQSKIQALTTPPSIRFEDLRRFLTDSPVVDNNPLEFDLRIDYFRQSDDRVITTFTIQTSNKGLKFNDEGGLQTARMNIFGKITSVSGKRSGIFEDSAVTNVSAQELVDARDRKFLYQKGLALTPGIYRADVIVRDVATGNKGLVSMGFTVPKYDPAKLSTSTLILASKLRSTVDSDIGQRFVIGGMKVVPSLSSDFKRGQEVGFYLQVYNAAIDQTTLRPAIDVEYLIMSNGKVVLRKDEDWAGSTDSGSNLTLARLLQTTELPPGNYELKIEIHDRAVSKTVERTGSFRIVP